MARYGSDREIIADNAFLFRPSLNSDVPWMVMGKRGCNNIIVVG